MYHLLSGLYAEWTRKEQFNILMLGLDGAGKTSLLERIKSMYNNTPALPPHKITPTVGQNIAKITLPSTVLQFWDLGGQQEVRPIWPRYFDDCHALVFVVDASADAGQGGGGPRLEEAWEVLETLARSPSIAGLPILILANKLDLPSASPVTTLHEFFSDRIQRAEKGPPWSEAERKVREARVMGRAAGASSSLNSTSTSTSTRPAQQRKKSEDAGEGEGEPSTEWEDLEEQADDPGVPLRMDEWGVLGVSAHEGTGVREAVDWLYLRVQNNVKR